MSCYRNDAFKPSERPVALSRVLIGAALLCAMQSAGAATYYVTTSGNDTWPGSQTQPWRTLQRALNATNPGDTVLAATGTYRESVTFTRSGTAAAKIVLKNAPGHFPVIDGQGLSIGQWGALVGFSNVGYVRFEGFEVRNSSAYQVYVGGESHHVEVVGNSIHDGSSSGIWLDGPTSRPAMSLLSGNRIFNHQMGGITVWAATGGYYRIEGNEVFGNKGAGNYDGIQVGGGDAGSHHVIVKKNVVHDNGAANVGEDGIDLGGHALCHHYLVESNVMYGGTGSFKLHSGQLKSGWYIPGVSSYHIARFNQFTGKGYVVYEYPNPIAVYNNTFVNCGQCVLFYGEDSSQNQNLGDSTYAGGDAGRMNWKNNLFYQDAQSSDYVLLTGAGPGSATIDLTYRSVRFQNNMYKLVSGQSIIWNAMFTAPITDAVFSSYKSSSAPNYPDTGSLLTTATTTQMFMSSTDYHLASGSPAIDKGTPLTKAVNSGTNSTTLAVDRASYFQDGYCVSGECLNTPDSIVIGKSAPVRIVAINDATNVITLATPLTWVAGTAVTLPYSGNAPDIGAYESGGGTALPAPTNLRVMSVQ